MATIPLHAAHDSSEEARLKAVYSLDLLDTPEEPEYDELVRLAAEICGTPISTITIVDAHRQWFKAALGLRDRETPRSVSFCAQAMRHPDLFVVENAATDPFFRHYANVVSDPGIRFYAGMPLEANGFPIGTLCVIDTVPRTLTESQRNALRILCRQVKVRIELRAKQRTLEAALEEKLQLTRRLERSTQILQTFVQKNPNICFLKSSDGKYLTYNSRFAEHFGIDEQAWLNKTDLDVRPHREAVEARTLDVEVLAQHGVHESVRQLQNAQGQHVWHKAFKFPIRLPEGESILAGVALDITDEIEKEQAIEQANRQLAQLATQDALTGLANRRVFEERVATDFAVARRTSLPLSLLMLDIDDFKKRNDTYGHAAGDDALCALAEVLKRCGRAGDVVARIGGEEFVILLTATPANGAMLFAERLQSQIRAIQCSSGLMTVSIGIATQHATTSHWKQLLDEADKAMYQAKRSGKNRCVAFSDASETPANA